MAEVDNFEKWDELIPDVLGLIFKNLSLREVLTVVPSVCKSWRRTVMGPYCWHEIDLEEWSRDSEPEVVYRMLQLLIPRSGRSLQKLCVSGLTDDRSISFIANHAQSLQTLRLPRCEVPDPVIEHVARMFTNITTLDLSYCLNIGARALKAIGNNCKFLVTLCRVMHPLEVINKPSQDDEALAIANTMPKLRHLEIVYLLFVDTSSVKEIICKCKYLEFLDIRGCWDVKLDKGFIEGFPKLKVIGPFIDNLNSSAWDNLLESSGLSRYLAWDFLAGNSDLDDEVEEYAEMHEEYWGDEEENYPVNDVETWWFYNDVNALVAGSESDWPHSP